jgi:hypothetical protein
MDFFWLLDKCDRHGRIYIGTHVGAAAPRLKCDVCYSIQVPTVLAPPRPKRLHPQHANAAGCWPGGQLLPLANV